MPRTENDLGITYKCIGCSKYTSVFYSEGELKPELFRPELLASGEIKLERDDLTIVTIDGSEYFCPEHLAVVRKLFGKEP